eukprot:COSAG06_NODE_1516_length_9225_cov_14.251260_9_plen_59_part_00
MSESKIGHGSFDVADHVLDGKAHLEQAARVALRRPAPRATAGKQTISTSSVAPPIAQQ